MSALVRVCVFPIAWVVWLMPFFAQWRRTRGRAAPARLDPRARWGILLAVSAYMVAFTHRPHTWAEDLPLWRAPVGFVFLAIALALGWGSAWQLGKQWRFDAGLNADHELVQTGAYKVVRHPIYASMLCMFTMSIAWIGTLPGWPIALVLFLTGTEIRIYLEDQLLLERFGAKFAAWKKSTPAYLPFIR